MYPGPASDLRLVFATACSCLIRREEDVRLVQAFLSWQMLWDGLLACGALYVLLAVYIVRCNWKWERWTASLDRTRC